MFSVKNKKFIALLLVVANLLTMSGFNVLSAGVAEMVYNARVNKEDTTNYYKEMLEYMYSVEYQSTKISYVQADTGFAIDNEEDLANYNAMKNKENDEEGSHTNTLDSQNEDSNQMDKSEELEKIETSKNAEESEKEEETEEDVEESEIEEEPEEEPKTEEEIEETEIEETTDEKEEETTETEEEIEETESAEQDIEETTKETEIEESEIEEVDEETTQIEEEIEEETTTEIIESETETTENTTVVDLEDESNQEETTKIEETVQEETTSIKETTEEITTKETTIVEETTETEETTMIKNTTEETSKIINLEVNEGTESNIEDIEVVEASESEVEEIVEKEEDIASESEIEEIEETLEKDIEEATESEIIEASESDALLESVEVEEDNVIVASLQKYHWNVEKILLDDTKIPMIKNEEDIEDIKEHRLPKEVQVVLKNDKGQEKTISVKTSWIIEEMPEEEVEEWIKLKNKINIDEENIVSSSNEAQLAQKYQDLIKDKLGKEKEVVIVEKTNDGGSVDIKTGNEIDEVYEEEEEEDEIVIGMLGDTSYNEEELNENTTDNKETTKIENSNISVQNEEIEVQTTKVVETEETTTIEETKEIVDLEVEPTTKEEITEVQTTEVNETKVESITKENTLENREENKFQEEETSKAVETEIETTIDETKETEAQTKEIVDLEVETTTKEETIEDIEENANLQNEETEVQISEEETEETTTIDEAKKTETQTKEIVDLEIEPTTKEETTEDVNLQNEETEEKIEEETTTQEVKKEVESFDEKNIEETTIIEEETTEELKQGVVSEPVAQQELEKVEFEDVDDVEKIIADKYINKTQMEEIDKVYTIYLDEEFLFAEITRILQEENKKDKAKISQESEAKKEVEEEKKEENLLTNILKFFKAPKITKASNNEEETTTIVEDKVSTDSDTEKVDNEEVEDTTSVNEKAQEIIDDADDTIIEISYNPDLSKRFLFAGGILKVGGEVHNDSHPLCGSSCIHGGTTHNCTSWQPINPGGTSNVNLTGDQNNKYYYIEQGEGTICHVSGDITISGTFAICVNNCNFDFSNLRISGTGTVYICDCGTHGQISISNETTTEKECFNVKTLNVYVKNLVVSTERSKPIVKCVDGGLVNFENVILTGNSMTCAAVVKENTGATTLKMTNCKVVNFINTVGNGGFLSSNAGTTTINLNKTSFNTCSAGAGKGGAIYMNNAGTLSIEGNELADFMGCSAIEGGAIYVRKPTSSADSLKNLNFRANRSNVGGALYFYNTNPTLDKVTIDNSEAYNFTTVQFNSGAVYAENSTLTIKNNSAIRYCKNGAIYASKSTITIQSSEINNNTTEQVSMGQVLDYYKNAVSNITLDNTKIHDNQHYSSTLPASAVRTKITIKDGTEIYNNKDKNTMYDLNLLYDYSFCEITLDDNYTIQEHPIGVTVLKAEEQEFVNLWQNISYYNQLRKFGPNDVFVIESFPGSVGASNVIYVKQRSGNTKQSLYIGSDYKEVHYISQYEGQSSKVLGTDIGHIVQYYAATHDGSADAIVLSKPFDMAVLENRKPFEKEGTSLVGFVNSKGYLNFDRNDATAIENSRKININNDDERTVTAIYASETLKYKACGCMETVECDHPGFEGLNHIARGGVVAVDATTYDQSKRENWVLVTTISQLRYQYENKYTQYILQNDLVYEHAAGATDLIKSGVVILNGYKVVERVAGKENYWLGGTGGSYISDMEPFPKNTCVGTLQYDTVGYTLDIADLTNYQNIDANDNGDRFIRNVDITNSDETYSVNKLFDSSEADYVLENVKIKKIRKNSLMTGVSGSMIFLSSLKTNNVQMEDIKITNNSGTGVSGREFIDLKNKKSTISVIKNTIFDKIEALRIFYYHRDDSVALTNLDVLKFENFEMKNCKVFTTGYGIEIYDATTNAKMYMDKENKITDNEYDDKAQIINIYNVKNIVSTGSTLDIENNTMNVNNYSNNEVRSMVKIKGGILNNYEHELYGKVILTQNKFKFGGTVDTTVASSMVFTALYPNNYTNIKIGNEKIFIKGNTMENVIDDAVKNKNCSIYIDDSSYVAKPLFSQLSGTKMNIESYFNITTSDSLVYTNPSPAYTEKEAFIYENWDNEHVDSFDGMYEFISQRWGQDYVDTTSPKKYYISGSRLYLGQNCMNVIYQFMFSGQTSKKGTVIQDIDTLIRKGDNSANVVDFNDPISRSKYETEGYAIVGFVGHSISSSEDYYKTWDFETDVLKPDSVYPMDKILQAVYVQEDYKLKACGCAEDVECDHAGYDGVNHIVRGEKPGDDYDITKKQYLDYVIVATVTQMYYTFNEKVGSTTTKYNTQYILANDINFDDAYNAVGLDVSVTADKAKVILKGERVINFNNHKINCSVGLEGVLFFSYPRKTYVQEPNGMPNIIVLGNTDAERAAGIEYTYDYAGVTLDSTNYFVAVVQQNEKMMLRNMTIKNYDNSTGSARKIFDGNVSNTTRTMYSLENILFDNCILRSNAIRANEVKLTNVTFNNVRDDGSSLIYVSRSNEATSSICAMKNVKVCGGSSYDYLVQQDETNAPTNKEDNFIIEGLDVNSTTVNKSMFSMAEGLTSSSKLTKVTFRGENKIYQNDIKSGGNVLKLNYNQLNISTDSSLEIKENMYHYDNSSTAVRSLIEVYSTTKYNSEEVIDGSLSIHDNKYIANTNNANSVFRIVNMNNYTKFVLGNSKVVVASNSVVNVDNTPLENLEVDNIYVKDTDYITKEIFKQKSGTKLIANESKIGVAFNPALKVGLKEEILVYDGWDQEHVEGYEGSYDFVSVCWSKDDRISTPLNHTDRNYYISGSKLYLGQNYTQAIYQFMFAGQVNRKGNVIKDIETFIRADDKSANIVDLGVDSSRADYEVEGHSLIGFIGHSKTYSIDYYKNWNFETDILDCDKPLHDRVLQAVYVSDTLKEKICGCPQVIECDHIGYAGAGHVLRGVGDRDHPTMDQRMSQGYVVVSTITQLYYTYDQYDPVNDVYITKNTQYILYNDIVVRDTNIKLRGERAILLNGYALINDSGSVEDLFDFAYPRENYYRESGLPQNTISGCMDVDYNAGHQSVNDFTNTRFISNQYDIKGAESVLIRNMKFVNFATSSNNKSLFKANSSVGSEFVLENITFENVKTSANVIDAENVRMKNVKFTKIDGDDIVKITNMLDAKDVELIESNITGNFITVDKENTINGFDVDNNTLGENLIRSLEVTNLDDINISNSIFNDDVIYVTKATFSNITMNLSTISTPDKSLIRLYKQNDTNVNRVNKIKNVTIKYSSIQNGINIVDASGNTNPQGNNTLLDGFDIFENDVYENIIKVSKNTGTNDKISSVRIGNTISIHNNIFYDDAKALYIDKEKLVVATSSSLVVNDNNHIIPAGWVAHDFTYMYLGQSNANNNTNDFYGSVVFDNNSYTVNNYHINNRTNAYSAIQLQSTIGLKFTIGSDKVQVKGTKILESTDSELTEFYAYNLFQKNTNQPIPMFVQAPGTKLNSTDNKIFVTLYPANAGNNKLMYENFDIDHVKDYDDYYNFIYNMFDHDPCMNNGTRNRYYKSETENPTTHARKRDLYLGSNCAQVAYQVLEDEWGYVTRDVGHEETEYDPTTGAPIIKIVTESVTSWEVIKATYTTVESQYYIKGVEIKLGYVQPSYTTNRFIWKATRAQLDGTIYYQTFNEDMSDAYYTLVSDIIVVGREVLTHKHLVYGYTNSTTSNIMNFNVSGYDEDSLANACAQIALQRDIHITHKLPIKPDKDYAICLNGHSIYIDKIDSGEQWFQTENSNSKIYICDCQPKELRGGIYNARINDPTGLYNESAANFRMNIKNDFYLSNINFKDNTRDKNRELSMMFYMEFSEKIHVKDVDIVNNDISKMFMLAYNREDVGDVGFENVNVLNNNFYNTNFLNVGRKIATYTNLKIENNTQLMTENNGSKRLIFEHSKKSTFENMIMRNNKVNNSLLYNKLANSSVYITKGLIFENNEIATYGDIYPLWDTFDNTVNLYMNPDNDGKQYIIKGNTNVNKNAEMMFSFAGTTSVKNLTLENNFNKNSNILTFGSNANIENVNMLGNVASDSYIIKFLGDGKDVNIKNTNIKYNGVSASYSNVNGGLIYASGSHLLMDTVDIIGNYGNNEGIYLKGHYVKNTSEMFMKNVNINDNHNFSHLLYMAGSRDNSTTNKLNLNNVNVKDNDIRGDVVTFKSIKQVISPVSLKIEQNKAYKSVLVFVSTESEMNVPNIWTNGNSITNNHLYTGKNSTVSDTTYGAIRLDGFVHITNLQGTVIVSGNYDCNGEEANLEINDDSSLLLSNKLNTNSRIHIRKTNIDKQVVGILDGSNNYISGAWNETWIADFNTFSGGKVFNDIDEIFITDGQDTETTWATVSDVWVQINTKPKHIYKKGTTAQQGPGIFFGKDYEYLLYQDQDVEPPRIVATQCIARGVNTTYNPIKDDLRINSWYGPIENDEENTRFWTMNGKYDTDPTKGYVNLTKDGYARVGTHKHGTDEYVLIGNEAELKTAITGNKKKIALRSGVTLTDTAFYANATNISNLNGATICLNSFAIKINTGVTFVNLNGSGKTMTVMDCLKSLTKGSISSDGGAGDINKHAFQVTNHAKLTLKDIDIRNFNGGSPIYATNNAEIDISGLDIKFNNVDKGAIYLDHSTAVAHSKFLAQGNKSEYGGGFYAANESTVTFEDDASFTDNTAYIYGGGMYFTGHSKLYFKKDAVFENNKNEGRREAFGKVIGGDGGGLYMNDSCSLYQEPTSNILFRKNYALNDGGGLYLARCDDATITFRNLKFEENEAYNGGAMVIASSSAVTIASMSFKKNKANMTAGAMYLLSNTGLTVDDCTFEENRTGFDVHTLNEYVYKVDPTEIEAQDINMDNYKDYVFVMASRSYSAEVKKRPFDERDVIGIVYDVRASDSSASPTDKETVIIYTRLDELFGDGGAMCIKSNGYDRNLIIKNSTFVNNYSGNGGAMKVDDTHGGTTIEGCYFTRNRANTGSGGAMLVSNIFRSDFDIKNTNFIANIASKSGGAISFTGVEDDQETYSRTPGEEDYPCGLNIYECAFYDNEAQNSTAVGGAISAVNAERITIQGLAYHTIIPGATDSETGVYVATREETTPREVTFRGNKAGFAGGAIYYNELMYSSGLNHDLFDTHPGDVGLILNDVSIQGNECGYYGGGIFLRASYSSVVLPVTQNKGNIEDNVCTGQLGTGGAMYLFGKVQYIVDDVTLKNNYAVIGGNVYVNAVKTHMKPVYKVFIDGERQEHEIKFKNVRLSGGDAPKPEYRTIQNGGAFAIYYGKVELDACDISSCNNALYTVGGDILTKNNTRIHNNRGQYSVGFSSFMKSTISLVDTFVINNETTEEPILTLFAKDNPNTPSQVTKSVYQNLRTDPSFDSTYAFDGEIKNRVYFGGRVIFRGNYYTKPDGTRLDNNISIHDDRRMFLAGSTEYPLKEDSELWINAKEGMRVFSEWGPTRIDRHGDGNMYSRIFRIDNEETNFPSSNPSVKPVKIYKQGLAANVVYDTPDTYHIEGEENCHLYLGRDYVTLEYIEDWEPYVRLATEYIAKGTPTTADSCFVEGFGNQRYVQIWRGPAWYRDTGVVMSETKWNIKQKHNNDVKLLGDNNLVKYQLRHVHRFCGLQIEGTCSEAGHNTDHEYYDFLYLNGDTNEQRLNKINLPDYIEDFGDTGNMLAVLLYQSTLSVTHSIDVDLAQLNNFALCLNGGTLDIKEGVQPFKYTDSYGVWHEGIPENCNVYICDCEEGLETSKARLWGSINRQEDREAIGVIARPLIDNVKGTLGLYRLNIKTQTFREAGANSFAKIHGGSLEMANVLIDDVKTVTNIPFIDMDESNTGHISIGQVEISNCLGTSQFLNLSAKEASISEVYVHDNYMDNNPIIHVIGDETTLYLSDGRYINNRKQYANYIQTTEGIVYGLEKLKSLIPKGVSVFTGNRSESGYNGNDGGVMYLSDIGPMTEDKVHGVMVFTNNEVDKGTIVIGTISKAGDLYSMYIANNKARIAAPGIYAKGPTVGNNTLKISSLSVIKNTLLSSATNKDGQAIYIEKGSVTLGGRTFIEQTENPIYNNGGTFGMDYMTNEHKYTYIEEARKFYPFITKSTNSTLIAKMNADIAKYWDYHENVLMKEILIQKNTGQYVLSANYANGATFNLLGGSIINNTVTKSAYIVTTPSYITPSSGPKEIKVNFGGNINIRDNKQGSTLKNIKILDNNLEKFDVYNEEDPLHPGDPFFNIFKKVNKYAKLYFTATVPDQVIMQHCSTNSMDGYLVNGFKLASVACIDNPNYGFAEYGRYFEVYTFHSTGYLGFNQFTFSFMGNGGFYNVGGVLQDFATKSVALEREFGYIPIPIRTGYSYVGINLEPDGSGIWLTEDFFYEDTSIDTAYAQWVPNHYTLRYDKNAPLAMNTMADVPMIYDVGYNLDNNQFTYKRYEFAYWEATLSNGTVATFSEGDYVVNLRTATGAIANIKAIWNKLPSTDSYIVKFTPGDMAPYTHSTMSDIKVLIEATFSMPENGFELFGDGERDYVFGYWRLVNVPYDDYGDQIPPKATFSVGDTAVLLATDNECVAIVEAVWVPRSYYIKFFPNPPVSPLPGATNPSTGTMQIHKRKYGETTPLPKSNYKVTGYTFAGWSTDSNATEPTYMDEEGVSKLTYIDNDIVDFYGVWKNNTYKIYYEEPMLSEIFMEPKYVIATYDMPFGNFVDPEATGSLIKTKWGWTWLKCDDDKLSYNEANQWALAQDTIYNNEHPELHRDMRSGIGLVNNQEVYRYPYDTTIYMIYNKAGFEIRYKNDDGTPLDLTLNNFLPNVHTNTTDLIKEPIRPGYKFLYWEREGGGYPTSTDKKKEFEISATDFSLSNRTYIAHWNGEPIVVHYDRNGKGDLIYGNDEEDIVLRGETLAIKRIYSPSAKMKNQDYSYYSDKSDGTGNQYKFGQSYEIDIEGNEITLYAIWHKVNNGNGGGGGGGGGSTGNIMSRGLVNPNLNADNTAYTVAGNQIAEVEWYKDVNSEWHAKAQYVGDLKGWQKICNNNSWDWYYFDDEGKMQTGWLSQNNKVYYMEEYNGAGNMLTGRRCINGVWYDLNAKGELEGLAVGNANMNIQQVKSYDVDKTTVIRGDFIYDNTDNSFKYARDYSNGRRDLLRDGIYKINYRGKDSFYGFDETGKMLIGFQILGNNLYYFSEKQENLGEMAIGEVVIGENRYIFDEQGRYLRDQYLLMLTNGLGTTLGMPPINTNVADYRIVTNGSANRLQKAQEEARQELEAAQALTQIESTVYQKGDTEVPILDPIKEADVHIVNNTRSYNTNNANPASQTGNNNQNKGTLRKVRKSKVINNVPKDDTAYSYQNQNTGINVINNVTNVNQTSNVTPNVDTTAKPLTVFSNIISNILSNNANKENKVAPKINVNINDNGVINNVSKQKVAPVIQNTGVNIINNVVQEQNIADDVGSVDTTAKPIENNVNTEKGSSVDTSIVKLTPDLNIQTNNNGVINNVTKQKETPVIPKINTNVVSNVIEQKTNIINPLLENTNVSPVLSNQDNKETGPQVENKPNEQDAASQALLNAQAQAQQLAQQQAQQEAIARAQQLAKTQSQKAQTQNKSSNATLNNKKETKKKEPKKEIVDLDLLSTSDNNVSTPLVSAKTSYDKGIVLLDLN